MHNKSALTSVSANVGPFLEYWISYRTSKTGQLTSNIDFPLPSFVFLEGKGLVEWYLFDYDNDAAQPEK